MKALPKVVTVGDFDPRNLVMAEVEYATPPSYRLRRAVLKRAKRFCAKHCKAPNRIFLEFEGKKMRIRQHAVWVCSNKPFTQFHFVMLLNQKLGGPVQSKAPQEPAKTAETIDQAPTTVSVA